MVKKLKIRFNVANINISEKQHSIACYIFRLLLHSLFLQVMSYVLEFSAK